MEMGKVYIYDAVNERIATLYRQGRMDPWSYEYSDGNEDAVNEIIRLAEEIAECRMPSNAAIDISIVNVAGGLELDDGKLEYLWEKFEDVLVDDDECILDDFLGFEQGTHREEVWHWFDERYSGGVAGLMWGGGWA